MNLKQLFLLGATMCFSIYANATPYVYITSAEDLANFRDAVNSYNGTIQAIDDETKASSSIDAKTANVVLNGDIDLSELKTNEWTPIGTSKTYAFQGTFEGNNHTIRNLFISKEGPAYVGLFGVIVGATIKNLSVSGSITSVVPATGGIVGFANKSSYGPSYITNCHNYCTIEGTNHVGGILGQRSTSCIITDCTNHGNITGTSYIGGIVGTFKETLNNCVNYGTIKGTDYVGGLIGYCNSITGTSLTSCTNYGNIEYDGTTTNCGVLVGSQNFVQSTNCYYNTSATYPTGIATNNAIGAEPDLVYHSDGTTEQVIWNNKPFAPEDNSFIITKRANIEGHNIVVEKDGVYTCEVFHLIDGKPFSTPIDFTVENLTYDRAATASKIITMVLPVSLATDYLKGNLYVFDGFDGTNVHFSSYEGSIMEANTPFAIKPEDESTQILEDGAKDVSFAASDEIANIEINGLENFGTYEHDTLYSDTHFSYIAFSGGSLKRFKKINLAPFRTAFRLDLENSNANETLGLVIDNDLSGVLLVGNDPAATERVNVYDVQGRLMRANVEPSTCFEDLKDGMYFVNGTKFIINSGKQTIQTTKTLKHASASTGVAE